MKYIWIIMLAVVDIVWIIASVVEFIRAINVMLKWKCCSVFEWIDGFLLEVEDYATGCLFTHMFILFLISLTTFFYSRIGG